MHGVCASVCVSEWETAWVCGCVGAWVLHTVLHTQTYPTSASRHPATHRERDTHTHTHAHTHTHTHTSHLCCQSQLHAIVSIPGSGEESNLLGGDAGKE